MSPPVDLAIVGGYGDVGAEAARHWLRLLADPSTPGPAPATARLRIGGRDAEAANALARELCVSFALPYDAVVAMHVDVFDPASLDRFVADARIVLNAAGPSHRIGDRVAQSCLRAGADHVDAAGDDTLHAQRDQATYVQAQRRAVLSAGMHPGFSGLLPRWLATGMSAPRRLVSHIGLLDRFTGTAADDFLQGGINGDSESLAAWRHGPRKRALPRSDANVLDGFPEPVTLLPYLNREGERTAVALGLDEGDWYSAVEGRHVMAVLDRAHALPRDEAVAMLQRGSALDLIGRRARVVLRMELEGAEGMRSVLLQSRGNATLSGAFAAVACMAVHRGRIPCGRHVAADILDPIDTVATLQHLGVFDRFSTNDGPLSLLRHEEGVL